MPLRKKGVARMEPGREVELKLSIPPDRLARVMRSPQLRPPGARRAVTRALRNVYYDTPRLTLREQGIMLRVRESGRRYLQTVKSTAGSAAGLGSPAPAQRDGWIGDNLLFRAADRHLVLRCARRHRRARSRHRRSRDQEICRRP